MKTSTSEGKHGIQWTSRIQLDDLDFADDLALLSQTQQQMQEKTTSVAAASAAIGLNIHKRKSKVPRYNTACTNPITIDREDLEDVKTFTYLGSIIDEQGGSDANVQARIGKARAAYLQLRNIWNSKQLSINTKAGSRSMASDQICYTLVGLSSEAKTYTEQKLKDDLQNSNDNVKREALKELIRLIINGEKFPNLLMTVIRFVMPSQDHMIKKLLLLFWEVVPKYSSDGKLLHEMILVCDAYRKDLQHPNEFIRGSTLRFLCKLKEPELLEPIMPSIQQCLEHRHAYVRRNAVLAIFTIYKNFESLIPDAPEKILRFLEQEQDSSCKRNAFMMLLHVSQSTALDYLTSCLDEVQNFGDILQLIIVELIYKVSPHKHSSFYSLDASDMEVRQKTLNLTMDLVTARTAEELIKIFRKELIKACSTNTRPSASATDGEKSSADDHNSDESVYRFSLVHTIYDICLRFPEVLPSIVPTVCEILTYEEIGDTRAANEACKFLREILERFPQRKADILEKLMQIFPSIIGRETLRYLVWIFGEYCTTYEEINSFMTLIRQVIGELPLVDEELRRQASQMNSVDSYAENQSQPSVLISGDVNVGVSPAQRVTADGTYATQSAFTLRRLR
ncbi:unnamed protein product [Schistosoma margrebowiei]|uniref:Uncharacterized protein n=1 Tax=Schistosoma margrebowiei TaxID=48269 RepID=A0A183N498_9TREM|nr:unnamed protein product [Schistosoma margrebowiei]